MRRVEPDNNNQKWCVHVNPSPHFSKHTFADLDDGSTVDLLKVYGVAWEEDEKAYGLYNDWKNNDRQLLEMMIFNGIKGLERCCDQ